MKPLVVIATAKGSDLINLTFPKDLTPEQLGVILENALNQYANSEHSKPSTANETCIIPFTAEEVKEMLDNNPVKIVDDMLKITGHPRTIANWNSKFWTFVNNPSVIHVLNVLQTQRNAQVEEYLQRLGIGWLIDYARRS